MQRSVIASAAGISVSIPGQEAEFGASADIVGPRADHRSMSMIPAKQC
jgi:hypothetical protein